MEKIKNLSTSTKWLIAPLLVGCVFLISGCESKQSSAIKIEDQVVSNTGSADDKAVVDAFLKGKEAEVQKLSKQFSSYFTSDFSIDTSNAATTNGTTIPTLNYGGKPLNRDHSLPDRLTAQNPGAVATIFVKSGDDFIRISTSVKRSKQSDGGAVEEDDRAINSTLGNQHHAYSAILAGNSYMGTANLFGNIYMTEYTPIKDAKGTVIGIRFVGTDITNDIDMLKIKLGKS